MLGIGAALVLQACARDEPENGVNVVEGPADTRRVGPNLPIGGAELATVTRADGAVVAAGRGAEYELRYTIPREAAAITPLRRLLLADAEAEKARAMLGYRESFAELPPGVNATAWRHAQEWKPTAETEQLLVLVSNGWTSRAPGRRDAMSEALIWDKREGRRIALSEMFTDEARALAAIRGPFCDAFRAERGGTECPPFDRATIAPSRVAEGRFVGLGVRVPGSQAGEEHYVVEVPIPARLPALVDPRWRTSFAGRRPAGRPGKVIPSPS